MDSTRRQSRIHCRSKAIGASREPDRPDAAEVDSSPSAPVGSAIFGWLHAGRERARNLAACDVHAERARIPRTTPETAPTDSEGGRMTERGPDPRGGRLGGFARGTAPVVPSWNHTPTWKGPQAERPEAGLVPAGGTTRPGYRGREGHPWREGFGRNSREQPPTRGGPAPTPPPGPPGPSGDEGGRSGHDGWGERQRQEGNDRSDAERLPTRGILRGV